MKTIYKRALLCTVILANILLAGTARAQENVKYVMVIHGGAGTILKKNMTTAKEKAYTEALTEACRAGYEKLKAGATSVDAVQAAINVMENSPLFNAGKGAVFTHDGKNELDASIMEGNKMMAGAVAGVTTIKNPINAARAVMEKSEHVLMVGPGAEKFAAECGVTIVNPNYFWTKERWNGLKDAIKQDSIHAVLDHGSTKKALLGSRNYDYKFGTVGCVALDNAGNLAAGTSTGGMTNKKYGRVGDSPLIGAGTYCSNTTAGISCTGWGEFFIRNAVAKTVSDLIEMKGMKLQDAAAEAIKRVGAMGGDGGLIALDRSGNVAMPFNTEGMYRATVDNHGRITVSIYK